MDAVLTAPRPSIIDTLGEFLKELWRNLATVFTSAGEAYVTDLVTGDDTAPVNYFIGWGTGVGGAVKGDTTLGTESAETRGTAVETQPVADKGQWVATLTSLSGQSISEVGLFTAVTVGTMLIRKDFTPIPLLTDDQIEFTITLEMT